mgnify:CR=1 FL=1
MKYQIKQTETKKTFFGTKEVEKVYTFDTYAEALTFAIYEQINTITCIMTHKDESGRTYKANTTRKPFKHMFTREQFIRQAQSNPMHYIGTRFPEAVNLDHYYIYLFNTRQFHKLKKA